MTRLLAVLTAMTLLAGCAGNQNVSDSAEADLGEFRLGHNVVIASKMQKVPVSREATEEEWVTSLTNAFAERFERYEGNQLYHFGISVEGYSLAPPGVPLVATPKSAVVLNITIWDDVAGEKLNEKPHQMLIFESIGEGLIVGSGLTNTREEQLENLSFNAARELEKWLSQQQQAEGWFDLKPGTEPSTDASIDDADPSVPEPVEEVAEKQSDQAQTDPEEAGDDIADTPAQEILTDG